MAKFNKHILLVVQWLQNKDSVNRAELDSSFNAACDYYYGYQDTEITSTAKAAVYTAGTATYAAGTAYDAAYWLNKAKHSLNTYFDLTNEDREAYEEQAKYLNVLGVNNG